MEIAKNKKGKKNVKPHPLKKTGQKARDKEQRREDHDARVAYWQTLSPRQQLRRLNSRLGEGIGAKRQRARIAEAL